MLPSPATLAFARLAAALTTRVRVLTTPFGDDDGQRIMQSRPSKIRKTAHKARTQWDEGFKGPRASECRRDSFQMHMSRQRRGYIHANNSPRVIM